MYQITRETAKAWVNFLPPPGHENSRSQQFQGLTWVGMLDALTAQGGVSVKVQVGMQSSGEKKKKGQFSTGDDRFLVDLEKNK